MSLFYLLLSCAGIAGESPPEHRATAERGSEQPQGCAQASAAAGICGERTVQGHARTGRGFQGTLTCKLCFRTEVHAAEWFYSLAFTWHTCMKRYSLS